MYGGLQGWMQFYFKIFKVRNRGGRDIKCANSPILFTPPFVFLYNINIIGIGWLVGGSFMGETFLTINVTV